MRSFFQRPQSSVVLLAFHCVGFSSLVLVILAHVRINVFSETLKGRQSNSKRDASPAQKRGVSFRDRANELVRDICALFHKSQGIPLSGRGFRSTLCRS